MPLQTNESNPFHKSGELTYKWLIEINEPDGSPRMIIVGPLTAEEADNVGRLLCGERRYRVMHHKGNLYDIR